VQGLSSGRQAQQQQLQEGQITVTGKVASISGRQFTIAVGNNKLTVDTAQMGDNPFGPSGARKIEVGDRVQVTGTAEGLFQDDKLMANSILRLSGMTASSRQY
jgi:hypothetical protein